MQARIPMLFFLLLALSLGFAQTPLRTVQWADLQAKNSYDMKAARAWQPSAQLKFDVEAEPLIDGDRVRVVGWLSNSAPDSQLAVIFPVGALGFYLSAPHCIARPSTGPLMPPPAPPPPLALTLPPYSRFRMETGFSSSNCDWEPAKAREIEWSLLFWNEPRPHGVVRL